MSGLLETAADGPLAAGGSIREGVRRFAARARNGVMTGLVLSIGIVSLGGCGGPGTTGLSSFTSPADEDPLAAALRRDAELIERLQREGALPSPGRWPATFTDPAPGVSQPPAVAPLSSFAQAETGTPRPAWTDPGSNTGRGRSDAGSAGLPAPMSLSSLTAERATTGSMLPGGSANAPASVGIAAPTTRTVAQVAESAPLGSAMSPAERARDLAVRLSGELYRTASDADMPLPQLMTIAGLSIDDPSRAFDPDAFPALTPREREILAAFHAFCADLGRRLREEEDPEVAAEVAAALPAALKGNTELVIPCAAFCRSVDVFGKYQTFDQNVFLAGSGQKVVVYFELDQFSSVQDSNGDWVTDLSVELSILTASGVPVWRQPPTPAIDRNRNRRRDFFVNQIVEIPRALNVGAYAMKVKVRDEATGGEAEKTIEFTLVADERMVRG